MPYKPGGGNKEQLYNSADGEYCRNPQCERDEENLVLSKMFGINTNIPIQYPIFGIHDLDYCELIVKLSLNLQHPVISLDKITKYLLLYQEKDDKSKLLNSLGYNIKNYLELYEQILKGTNFSNAKLKDFSKIKFTINAETKIWDKINLRYYLCTTAWFIEKDFSVRFITLIPEVFKNEKN